MVNMLDCTSCQPYHTCRPNSLQLQNLFSSSSSVAEDFLSMFAKATRYDRCAESYIYVFFGGGQLDGSGWAGLLDTPGPGKTFKVSWVIDLLKLIYSKFLK